MGCFSDDFHLAETSGNFLESSGHLAESSSHLSGFKGFLEVFLKVF
jgi:hypothetical protein